MHIMPMFRRLDRQHMLRVNSKLDLWDYDSVKANADDILKRAGGNAPSMPTSNVGGIWPSEWRALFARWKAGGYRRLSLGFGQNYKLASSAGQSLLTCTVAIPDAPDGDSTAWFDIVDAGPSTATYRLYVFSGESDPPPADTTNLQIQERVDSTSAANGVTVIDSAGSHRVSQLVE
jgi:hypothetical protein